MEPTLTLPSDDVLREVMERALARDTFDPDEGATYPSVERRQEEDADEAQVIETILRLPKVVTEEQLRTAIVEARARCKTKALHDMDERLVFDSIRGVQLA